MPAMISLGQLFDKTIGTAEKQATHYIGITLWSLVALLPAGVAEIVKWYGEIGSVSVADRWYIWLQVIAGLSSFIVGVYVFIRLITFTASVVEERQEDAKAAWKKFWRTLWFFIVSSACYALLAAFPVLGTILFILQAAGIVGNTGLITGLGVFLIIPGGIMSAISLANFASSTVRARFLVVLDNMSPLKALLTSWRESKGQRIMIAIRYYLPRLVYVAIGYLLTQVCGLLVAFLGPSLTSIGVPAGFSFGLQDAIWLFVGAAIGLLYPVLTTINDYYLVRSLK